MRYFAATDGQRRCVAALWRSDGTDTRYHAVADIAPGGGESSVPASSRRTAIDIPASGPASRDWRLRELRRRASW